MRTNTIVGGLGGSSDDKPDNKPEDKPVEITPGDGCDGDGDDSADDSEEGVGCEDQQASREPVQQIVRPSFTNGGFIQTVVNQAICIVNNASEERGEFIQHGEFSEPVIRHLDPRHEDTFHSACDFLTEYFDGARNALSRENRHYSEWADKVERQFRDAQ